MDIQDRDLLDAITCGMAPPDPIRRKKKLDFLTGPDEAALIPGFYEAKHAIKPMKWLFLPLGAIGLELEPAFARERSVLGWWSSVGSDIVIFQQSTLPLTRPTTRTKTAVTRRRNESDKSTRTMHCVCAN